MTRLTRKVNYDGIHYGSPNGIPCDNLEHLEKVYTKLGQLEDIEENIGIDLITLFKALKGIGIKDNDRAYYVGCPYLRYAENWNRQLELQFRVGDIWYYVKDYGKTWALTKEELEK